MTAITQPDIDQRVYHRNRDFPPVVKASDELREKVSAKFAAQLKKRE